MGKRYYWLKLPEDFFRQKPIKKLRKIAGGDTYTIIYLKMLLIAMKEDGKLYFEGVEDDFYEELSLELDEDSENVKVTVLFLIRQGLMELIDETEYRLTECDKMVGSEKAKQKLEEEVKKTKDKEFADPIIRHLLKRCEEDPGMAEDILQAHKTWLKCFAHIRGEAKKRADGNCAVVRDDLVYEWAEDYFRLDDKAIEEKKEKERKEQEEKRKAEAAKRKSGSGKQKKKTDTKKDNREKKPLEPEKKIEKAPKSKEPEGQMSLFDLL